MFGDNGSFGPDTVDYFPTLTDYASIGASQNVMDITTGLPVVTATPQTIAVNAPAAAPTNWGGILTPIATAVSSIYTQAQITARQQNLINAGQSPGLMTNSLISTNAAGQSTLFGIPTLYVIGGIAAFMLMK
jgi:hypothetical protein